MLSARLRFFLAVSALWAVVFALGLALDDRLEGPWLLSATTLTRLGALSLPVRDADGGLRALSSLFLHSDALHLTGNILALALIVATWPLARMRGLAVVLLAGGCLAAVGSMVAYSHGLSVGPSGALCAALTTALCLPVRIHRKLIWLGLAAAFLIGGALSGGDQGAHVAGLLVGLGFGLLRHLGIRRGSTFATATQDPLVVTSSSVDAALPRHQPAQPPIPFPVFSNKN